MPQLDLPSMDNMSDLSPSPSLSYPQPLMDRFGRVHNYLRVSLTERCNFRCTYCMPPEGVELTPTPLIPTLEERKLILRTFIEDYGVDKLRFTGGEPTVSKELLPLVQYASSLSIGKVDSRTNETNEKKKIHIGMTTNGLLLHRQIDDLVAAGLNSVNISLDSLCPTKFSKISRRPSNNLKKVLTNINHVVDHYGRPNTQDGLPEVHVKLNIVLIKGVNDDEIVDFVQLTKDMPIDVRFIELMPFAGNGWQSQACLGYNEVLDLLVYGHGLSVLDAGRDADNNSSTHSNNIHHPNQNGDNANDTTKWYRINGYQGRIGFITTMTKPFCNTCNRLRVTADGKMKNCLFGDGEMNLLEAIRTPCTQPKDGNDDNNDNDNDNGNRMLLREYIQSSVRSKHRQLGGHASPEQLVNASNRSMIKIGG